MDVGVDMEVNVHEDVGVGIDRSMDVGGDKAWLVIETGREVDRRRTWAYMEMDTDADTITTMYLYMEYIWMCVWMWV